MNAVQPRHSPQRDLYIAVLRVKAERNGSR